MTAGDGDAGRPPSYYQDVRAENGFAYGVVGADIHVFQDRGPAYLLLAHDHRPCTDSDWLMGQPSRLLNARFQVVDFTGRDRELAELAAWRDQCGSRLSAMWLHGPGGQGKTRLAAEFSGQSAAAGWKVITVSHGPGAIVPDPGSQDMRLGGAVGLLLVIDYADRWPVSHLAWLFSNALLHKQVPTRLLLLARSVLPWAAIRSALEALQADTREQPLQPVSGVGGLSERERVFTVARDCFAERYNLPDPTLITLPCSLEEPEFGLTLALHIAALVAVDARARQVTSTPPSGMIGLSAYLLNRERRLWTQLYENHVEGLEFETPPREMARAVFTACITGAVTYAEGRKILDSLGLEQHAGRLLDDHAFCYRAADARAVLEPLYPDRLAEDFLALTLPGHDLDGYPADAWAGTALARLLPGPALWNIQDRLVLPGYGQRAGTVLIEAARRWPHVAEGHLYPLLREKPWLAVQAGSTAMGRLADIDGVDTEVLEAIDLIASPHIDLSVGTAAIARRLARHRLSRTGDPADYAAELGALGSRLAAAGLHDDALTATDNAVTICRRLAAANPDRYEPELAAELARLGVRLAAAGRDGEALAAGEEGVSIRRRLAAAHPDAHEPALADGLVNLSSFLGMQQRHTEGLTAVNEALQIYNQLVPDDPDTYLPGIAAAHAGLGDRLGKLQRWEEAVSAMEQSVRFYRQLAWGKPVEFEPNLASALRNLSLGLGHLGRFEDALPPAEEAVGIRRELAAANPGAHSRDLAQAVTTLGFWLNRLDRLDNALAAVKEVAEIRGRLPAAHRLAADHDLASLSASLGIRLGLLSRWEEAASATEQAVQLYRWLAENNSANFIPDIADALYNLSIWHAGIRDGEQAVAALDEAVMFYRYLADSYPDEYASKLADALGLLDFFKGGP